MDELIGQTLKGATKSVFVEADAITISFRALYHGFVGDKRIPFRSITSIQFKDAGNWLDGYIQFSILGGVEWRGMVSQDENAILFPKPQEEKFRALRDYAQTQMGVGNEAALPRSVADKLTKLAGLRDQGILSDEEFDDQKAKLLQGG